MPLLKRSLPPVVEETQPQQGSVLDAQTVEVVVKKSPTKKHIASKDEYWTNREERDIHRDKDMAWSGLAQAALSSVSVAQLNVDNTKEGLVKLVAELTALLLKERDAFNSAH